MRKFKRASIFILAILLVVCFCQPVIAVSGKIDINTGSKEQLMTLKYIGEKMADRIIEYRKAHLFEKIEDIMKVKGIGQKMFDANKDLIIVKDE
jgi:competence protein ComEA